MKKVMILGAGEGQMPFIKICKDRGYKVIVVSIPGNYPGFREADKSYYIDTRDKEKILEIAYSEKIDAILTDQTDVSVPTVAYVSEKMGLRGIGYETSLKFTNKYLMRKAAKAAGVAVPQFEMADNIEQAITVSEEIGFPLIIKPIDSSGSRGVLKINNLEELKHNFGVAQNFSSTNQVILEQFIVGKEYLADGFAMGGSYVNLDLGEKEYFDVPNIFVSKMCMFTSAKMVNDHVGRMVLETNEKLIRNIGLEFGITHAEYLYNEKEDKVYLVEIAARGGGVYLSSHITPTVSGIDTNCRLIDYVVNGNMKQVNKDELLEKISGWICFAFPEGEIVKISGMEEVRSIEGVYLVDMSDIYIGKKTVAISDDSEKYGPILFEAQSPSEVYNILKKVRETLSIDIKTDNGIKGLIW